MFRRRREAAPVEPTPAERIAELEMENRLLRARIEAERETIYRRCKTVVEGLLAENEALHRLLEKNRLD